MVVVVHVSIPIGDIPVAGFGGFVPVAAELEFEPAMASAWLARAKRFDRGRRRLDCDHGF